MINVNTPNARPTQSQIMSLVENSLFLQYLSYISFRIKTTTVIMTASHNGINFDSHITRFWQTIMCAMPSIPILDRSLLANALILFAISPVLNFKGFINPINTRVIIFRIYFKSYILSIGINTSYSGRATTDKRVHHHITWFCN